MNKTIKLECECPSCKGTGVYAGMGERDGLGIECHTCKGTGKSYVTYTPFTSKKKCNNITHVIKHNIGYCLNPELTKNYNLTYEEWYNGKQLPVTEDRERSCPCWWYQSVDYTKKPNWDECNSSLGFPFSKCKHFCNKIACWARWDKEFGNKQRCQR